MHTIVDWHHTAHPVCLRSRGSSTAGIALELVERLLSAEILIMLASAIVHWVHHVVVGEDLQLRRRRSLPYRLLLLGPALPSLFAIFHFLGQGFEHLAFQLELVCTLLASHECLKLTVIVNGALIIRTLLCWFWRM